ncbi:MAG: 16S rRNA (cytosine(1402)-N(4))-methyltransferase RsmH [Candidatus Nanopelagicales bacterium]
MTLHTPVLLERCVELFAPSVEQSDAVYVDATLGLGGHAEAMLTRFPDLQLIGIDRDTNALELAAERLAPFSDRIELVHAKHEDIGQVIDSQGAGKVDAILFDLGVSSMQLDQRARGFSYNADAPLDMRMNQEDELTAATVVNTYAPGDLVRILREYGEEKNAKRIVSELVRRRQIKPLTTTGELVEVIDVAIPAPARRKGGNPSKRTFQALRIEVNQELVELDNALQAGIDHLRIGGRMIVLSYHSLEDRIVKRRFAAGSTADVPHGLPVIPDDSRPYLRLLTRGSEVASKEEIGGNRRAMSAKLRAVEVLREAA